MHCNAVRVFYIFMLERKRGKGVGIVFGTECGFFE